MHWTIKTIQKPNTLYLMIVINHSFQHVVLNFLQVKLWHNCSIIVSNKLISPNNLKPSLLNTPRQCLSNYTYIIYAYTHWMVFWFLRLNPLTLCDMPEIYSRVNMYSTEYYNRTDMYMFQEKYVPTTDSEHVTVFYSMEYYVLSTC